MSDLHGPPDDPQTPVKQAVTALAQAANGETGIMTHGGIEFVFVPRDALQLLLATVAAKIEKDGEGLKSSRKILRPSELMPQLHPEQR